MRSDRLKELRVGRGFTQTDLAERVETSASQIKRWENGETIPSSEALRKLSTVLEVTSDYLLGLVDTPNSKVHMSDLSPDEQELIIYIRSGMLPKALKALATLTENEEAE